MILLKHTFWRDDIDEPPTYLILSIFSNNSNFLLSAAMMTMMLMSTGGLLIETYAKGGMLAAEKLIREEFSMYMYAGGKGRVINRAEYLRWKFRDQEQVKLQKDYLLRYIRILNQI